MRQLSALAVVIIPIFVSTNARALEEPDFSVVAAHNGIEVRRYEAYLVAETVVKGSVDRDKAANVGFRRLFGYISGRNEVQAEIAMTAPVRQQATGTEIAMTAPVRQMPDAAGWTIAFVVPDKFNETNVPQPTDPAVRILPFSLPFTRRNEVLVQVSQARVE